jgi:flavin-dependent dehydrogenase
MRADVAVVGGSVAGAVAARELARRGLRVALYEKARFPRLKPCGEGLLPHGVAALEEMGLEPGGVPVRGLRFVSPSGATAEADFPNGARGRVVRRDRFDAALFAAAAATPGVEAFPGTAWDPVRHDARWIVGADGLHSQFHRRPEFPAAPPSTRRVGLSTHAIGLDVDRERVEIVIHDRGELYLAPSEDGGALVACLFRDLPDGRSGEDRVLELLLSLDVLRGRTRGLAFTTPVLACAPLGLRVGAVAAGNVLLVGDAAGAPDPITGEGMSLAILSARALADAVAAGDPERYERERRRLAGGSDWLGRWLLRATRYPAIADRVVGSLLEHPELFAKLLEIAVGARRPGDLSLVDVARLLV